MTRATPFSARNLTPALVGGPVLTGDNVADLRGFAYDVCDQIGAPATYATHSGYRVTDYAALYISSVEWTSGDVTALVLIAEALSAGVPVHGPQDPRKAVRCDLCAVALNVYVAPGHRGDMLCGVCRYEDVACAWCLEPSDDDARMDPFESGSTWWPAHHGCIAEGLRVHGPEAFVTQ
ncbi:hypothetical protein [Streptomyces subrutilus]|uniref:hypothetical protein n=1 Tax=Streptomyces subrutilus TaxID=36818 RepID=UPI002E1502F4|nr:hypothetical protein OG479_27825 [Streptomyces subrutilus]